MIHKKKFVNFRFFVCLAASIIATLLLSVVLSSVNLKWILFGILLGFGIGLTVLFFVIKRKVLIFIGVILLICVLPLLGIISLQNKINKNLKFDGNTVFISGRICSYPTYSSSGNLKLTLDNLTLTNSSDCAEISGKINVYIRPQNLEVYNFVLGEYIEVLGDVYMYELKPSELSYIANGVVGYSYFNFYDIVLTGESKLSLKEKFKEYVYQKLDSSGTAFAEVGYAMLFGDTSLIDSSTLSTYQDAGIVHLLAVSGLHVSVLVMLINFVLKKLKASPRLRFIIEFVILLLYAYLCNFSVSVLRASIMGLLFAFANLRGKPYDRLSSLSLAAILILMVNPAKLFSISFILSFGSVLIIVLTILPLARVFSKIFNSKIAETIAVNVGLQIGILALNIYYFGKYPILSLVSNFISVPIQSFAFALLMILMPIVLVFPFAAPLIKVFGILTSVVVKFNTFINGFGLVLTMGNVSFLPIVITFIFLFCAGDYLFIKRKHKVVTGLVLLASLALSFLI